MNQQSLVLLDSPLCCSSVAALSTGTGGRAQTGRGVRRRQPSRREGHLLGLGEKDGGVGRRNKQVYVHPAHMATVWESQRFQHAVQ